MKSGWVTKRLGEVCETVTPPLKLKASDYLPSGKYPVVSQDDGLVCGYTNQDQGLIKLKRPVVIFGDHTKAVKYVDFDFVQGADGVKILEANASCDPRYLYYVVLNAPLRSLGYARHFKLLKQADLNFPESLPEQHRIVAKIDAAFAKIDRLKANAEKNRTNAKELFQSALNEAMRPKPGWVEKRLGEVAEIRVGPFGSSLHKADYVAKGVPLVNPCHMRNSQIQEHIETQITEEKANELSAYRLREGDIVFARRGEIGRLAFVSSREDGYLCGTGSLFARFSEKIDPEFLYFVFSSRSFVERLEKLSTGATMKSINSVALSGMAFFMPPDAVEMKKSVELLDSLRAQGNRMKQNYTRLIADCAEMRQTVLKEAFEGRL